MLGINGTFVAHTVKTRFGGWCESIFEITPNLGMLSLYIFSGMNNVGGRAALFRSQSTVSRSPKSN